MTQADKPISVQALVSQPPDEALGQGVFYRLSRSNEIQLHPFTISPLISQYRSSMSGTGNCFDNAPMESFWGTLKQELVHHRHYATRQQAMRDITEYIEIFYNRQRRQERLGFLSPAAYAQKFYAEQLAV